MDQDRSASNADGQRKFLIQAGLVPDRGGALAKRGRHTTRPGLSSVQASRRAVLLTETPQDHEAITEGVGS